LVLVPISTSRRWNLPVGISPQELTTRKGRRGAAGPAALEHRSGLLGLAGTADMREVVAAAEDGDGDARLALEVYLHRLRAGVGAMAATLGGLDALVFTGGVGENAPTVRRLAVEGLGFLGLRLDPERNRSLEGDGEIGADGATSRLLLVAAREDLQIAGEVRQVLSAGG
jgi:acetate kinase